MKYCFECLIETGSMIRPITIFYPLFVCDKANIIPQEFPEAYWKKAEVTIHSFMVC